MTKFAAYVMRRPGTTSSPFRRTFTDPNGNTEKLVFAPGKPVGVTAEQAEFLRDDIAKGVLVPCLDDSDSPKADEELVDVIREEFEADQKFERESQLVQSVGGNAELLPKDTPPKPEAPKPQATKPTKKKPAKSEAPSTE